MTRFSKTVLAGAIALTFSASAFAQTDANTDAAPAGCSLPSAPIIPDGNVASQDELVAAQGAFKGFEAKILDFRDCLTAEENSINPEAETAEAEKAAILARDNTAVDNLKAVAEEFNKAVRAFKAR